MNVYTFEYDTTYGDTLVSVFGDLDAVITRLKLMQFQGTFEECESVKITCADVVDDAEMQLRLERVKKWTGNNPRN